VILSWVGERLGVAMKQAEDIILRDYLMGNVQQYNCRGGSNGDNPTNLSVADFSAVAQTLSTNNAFKFLNGKLGEDRYGSSPIRAAYFMFASTEIEAQLDGLAGSGFTSSWNYPNQNDVCYSEYGALLNFRIFTSSEASVQRGASANGNDVFQNLCVAKESYAHIDQDGYSMQLIYRPPIFSGPLALNGTLGVKFAQAQAVTQSTWLRNMRCSALV
jgi:N4-gp56 family major capsid protein